MLLNAYLIGITILWQVKLLQYTPPDACVSAGGCQTKTTSNAWCMKT
jgi:hypothetical protein